ncbi:MAG: amidohydrolase family protein [Oscillospiraceae bacterium]|nr:amidohydrolase family protein [Oscillospiraceae bacterium]
MKTLLKHATIYDGTVGAPFVGSVLYEGDRILEVAANIDDSLADEVVDLTGLSLSSGFIDAHSHNDWFAIKQDPQPYFEPFVRQGITTFVTGNCGLSSVGFESNSQHVDKIGGGLFFFNNTTGTYGSADDFFNAVDENTPCNIALLVGHCSARAGVSGYASGSLSPEDEQAMLAVLEKNLQQGACGISLGLAYDPGLYADLDELKKIAALCLQYDKPLTVHARASSAVSLAYPQLLGRSHLLRAMDELVEVAQGTKLKLQYSHAIFVGRKSFKDKKPLLAMLHKLQQDGVDIGFDMYNETVGVSVITVILPAWYRSMSEQERAKPLNKLKLTVLTRAASKLLGFSLNDMQIAYAGENCREYEGKTVAEIAKLRGENEIQTYLHLCRESDFKGRVNMGPYYTQDIINDLCKEDMCIYMTDAWVEDFGVQNPAIYDCFPKFIRSSLTGSGDTMPRTIRKMTGQTADRFALKDRGYVRAGAYADLTVFSEADIKAATPGQAQSFGIERVVINGKTVLASGELDAQTLKTAGRAVRG